MCTRHTGFARLNRLRRRLHVNKAELLMVPDRPDIALRTNGRSAGASGQNPLSDART
jgi:hypothetical protein